MAHKLSHTCMHVIHTTLTDARELSLLHHRLGVSLRWMDGWMDGGREGGMEGWMDGWMDGWVDR